MRYFRIDKDGYLLTVGYGGGTHGEDITAEEYSTIKAAVLNRPKPPLGYDYRLRTDLTWELTELPPAPAEPTVYTQQTLEAMTNAELETILASYGISASMNKANMVQLILQAQGGDSIG